MVRTNNTFVKDPDATLNYGVDWEKWLEGSDIITASEWRIESDHSGADISIESKDFSDVETEVFISGGAEGQEYKLINKIETQDGKIDERTLRIVIEER